MSDRPTHRVIVRMTILPFNSAENSPEARPHADGEYHYLFSSEAEAQIFVRHVTNLSTVEQFRINGAH